LEVEFGGVKSPPALGIIDWSTFHKGIIVSPFIHTVTVDDFVTVGTPSVHLNATAFTVAAPRYTLQIT
jgi:hypothetical protein